MGKFEDAAYKHEIGNKKAIENAVDKDAEKVKQAESLKADFDKCIEQMEQAVSISMLEGLYKGMARRLTDRDVSMMRKLKSVSSAVAERLKKEDEK
jgi:hypothetical protein